MCRPKLRRLIQATNAYDALRVNEGLVGVAILVIVMRDPDNMAQSDDHELLVSHNQKYGGYVDVVKNSTFH